MSDETQWSDDSGEHCLVLLVDDQPIVAHSLARIVDVQSDVDLHYCPDPGDALVTAVRLEPTVILLDVVMPSVDGLDVLRLIRQDNRLESLPVVMLSTEEDAKVKVKAFELGANDYITKWPDPAELLVRIRYHSNFYRNRRQLKEALERLRISQALLTQKNIELEHLALHDGLTELFNRRSFNLQFDEEVRRAARTGTSIGVLMIDVDFFKKYNDHYGHLKGDECLRRVARVFVSAARRPGDICARYGGEEFVMILPGVAESGAHAVAETVKANLAAQNIEHEASEISSRVTVSIGAVVSRPTQQSRPEDLVGLADTALYRAKAAGRDQVNVIMEPEA